MEKEKDTAVSVKEQKKVENKQFNLSKEYLTRLNNHLTTQIGLLSENTKLIIESLRHREENNIKKKKYKKSKHKEKE